MGERLREARIAKRLTQEALAHAIGVRAMSISRFERGELNPSRETLMRLASALSVSTDWLLSGPPKESDTPPPAAA
jgi:transcriptional regulator with XRE-family HTH domain